MRLSNKDFEGKDDLEEIVFGFDRDDLYEDYGYIDYDPYWDELFNLIYDVPESCYDDEDDDDYE